MQKAVHHAVLSVSKSVITVTFNIPVIINDLPVAEPEETFLLFIACRPFLKLGHDGEGS